MKKKDTDTNYLIIKEDKRYRVEERSVTDIYSNVTGILLSSTTHRQDAYNAVNVLNHLISKP